MKEREEVGGQNLRMMVPSPPQVARVALEGGPGPQPRRLQPASVDLALAGLLIAELVQFLGSPRPDPEQLNAGGGWLCIGRGRWGLPVISLAKDGLPPLAVDCAAWALRQAGWKVRIPRGENRFLVSLPRFAVYEHLFVWAATR